MPGKKNKRGTPTTKHRLPNRKQVTKGVVTKESTVSRKTLAALRESQKQLNIVLDAALMSIWEWSITSDKTSWAGRVLEMFGLPEESFAKNLDAYIKFVHPDDRPKIMLALQQSIALKKPFAVEHRVVLQDGTVRWLDGLGKVSVDKKGNAVKFSGTVQDITAKKLAEMELEEWKMRHEIVAISAGLVIYDYDIPSGKIIWSGNSIDVLGYEPDALGDINRWMQLIHKDDRQEAIRLLEEAKVTLNTYDVCYRFLMKNGNYRYLRDRGSFLPDASNRAARMIGMMSDVTEKIKAEQSLAESELRFRTLQQASFGGIGLHDKGYLIDCNQGLCDMTGYSYEELIGSDGLNLIAPEWRNDVMDKIKTGYDQTYDAEGIKKDGTRFFLEIRGKNIPYNTKTIRVTEFRDITDRKRTEQTIREQNTNLLAVTEDLKRKNNQLEEFTQIVSHNLRSPVGNILVLLNFFEGAGSVEEKAEYLMLLKESAATTLTMLNELNDILKIKQDKNIEKHDLYFEDILRQVQTMLNARITELSADITFDFSSAPLITYPTIYLESIFLNLLDNALKYHNPKRQPKIHLSTMTNENGEIILEARDNGLGINLERYGHHVFKLRKTFHLHPESRGIGLFLIKNQIEAMGGEITISSRENEGTSFFINFNKHQSDGY